jgi:glutamate 5-kinase
MSFDIELVCKVGSMALIDKEHSDIDYNIIARLSRELKPSFVLVTSGATEIGRLDYIKRHGKELSGGEAAKTDYAAQGQIVLMETYRRYVPSNFSIRQFLVEHQHFNDMQKREHLKAALLRCAQQNAVPIINYNDPVCNEETRKMEIETLRKKQKDVAECIDNDETASQIACLLNPRNLIILTATEGILKDKNDPSTLVREISGNTTEETLAAIDYYQGFCEGANRVGANGAKAKLEYIKEPVKRGTTVYIASSRYKIGDILSGKAPSTKIFTA